MFLFLLSLVSSQGNRTIANLKLSKVLSMSPYFSTQISTKYTNYQILYSNFNYFFSTLLHSNSNIALTIRNCQFNHFSNSALLLSSVKQPIEFFNQTFNTTLNTSDYTEDYKEVKIIHCKFISINNTALISDTGTLNITNTLFEKCIGDTSALRAVSCVSVDIFKSIFINCEGKQLTNIVGNTSANIIENKFEDNACHLMVDDGMILIKSCNITTDSEEKYQMKLYSNSATVSNSIFYNCRSLHSVIFLMGCLGVNNCVFSNISSFSIFSEDSIVVVRETCFERTPEEEFDVKEVNDVNCHYNGTCPLVTDPWWMNVTPKPTDIPDDSSFTRTLTLVTFICIFVFAVIFVIIYTVCALKKLKPIPEEQNLVPVVDSR